MPLATSSARALDAAALARHRRRLDAAPPPWLHSEVARRMAERLSLFKRAPRQLLDWWAHLGASHEAIQRARPTARCWAVEDDAARRDATLGERRDALPPAWQLRRWFSPPVQVLLATEVPAAAADMVWSNMGLHHKSDPGATMRHWLDALAIDGVVMFSTLGPGSLGTLRRLYRAQGWGAPMADLVDMHDLGDLLVANGFADPVMDQETVTLTWPDARSLLVELRQLGGNAASRRAPGLRTPRWRERLAAALMDLAGPDGRVALEFEIVYGHAFKPAPRLPVGAETQVSEGEMRALLRARRTGREGRDGSGSGPA